MFSAIALVSLIATINTLSTALIIILSIFGVALIVAEAIICGKIASEIVHKKDGDINEVWWFWLGCVISWVAILLTLVVKQKTDKEE